MATAKKLNKAQQVRAYELKHPNAAASEVAKACKTTAAYVYVIRASDKGRAAKVPKQLKWKHVAVAASDESLEGVARLEANRIYELTKGRERRHPVTGKILMQGAPMVEDKITMIEPQADNVNHPAHYKYGGIETIDFIEAKELGYNLGNVVKYITRSDHKGNRKEDLLKAQWYLNREIAAMSK
jgi:hypothetical protein